MSSYNNNFLSIYLDIKNKNIVKNNIQSYSHSINVYFIMDKNIIGNIDR